MNFSKKSLKTLLTLLFLLNSFVSIAEEDKTIKDSEESKSEEPKKESSFKSMNFYPRLNLNNHSLFFTGAETLKQGEFIFEIPFIGYYNYKNIDNYDFFDLNLKPNFSIGLFDNWINLNLQYPMQFSSYLSPELNLSPDIHAGIPFKVLSDPFTLTIQPRIKIVPTQYKEGFTEGYNAIGGDLIFNKIFEPLYIQGLIGYTYDFPFTLNKKTLNTTITPNTISFNTISERKYPNKIDYILSLGWNPELSFNDKVKESPFLISLTGYGQIPNIYTIENTEDNYYNYLSGRLNVLWKIPNFNLFFFNDAKLNFYYDQSIITSGMRGFSGGGVSFSLSHAIDLYAEILSKFPNTNIPRVISALSLINIPKTDSEQLMKKELKNADKGRKLYIETCGKCHALIKIEHLESKKWEEKVHSYRIKKVITKSEENAIMDFIKKYKNTKEIKN